MRKALLFSAVHLGNPSYNVGGLIVDRAEVYGCNVGMTVPQNTTSGGDEKGAVIHQIVLQNHVNVWWEFTKHLVEIKSAEFLPGADAKPCNLPDDVEKAGELHVAMVWPPYKRAHPVRRETRLFISGARRLCKFRWAI